MPGVPETTEDLTEDLTALPSRPEPVCGARTGWRKSRRSNPNGNCVELAVLATGEIAVRNSRDPNGPVLVYTRSEIAAFLGGAKDGDFDELVGN